MSELISNLNTIESCKLDIKSAIEAKGVSMSGVSFPDYATAIGSITTQFVTESLSVSQNGTYTPGQGVDGFSQVSVNVPQSVTGFTEEQLTERTFNIVNLNNSASYVASYAFVYSNVISVSLPNCTTINAYAFNSCYDLLDINIPNTTYIDQFAFANCSVLNSVFADELLSTGSYAFRNCLNLHTLNISKIRVIGPSTFYSCAFGQISIPDCSIICSDAMHNCFYLSQIDLPECNTLQNGVFGGCYSLSHISLPKCINYGGYVFQSCTELSELSLPVCVTLGNYAFQNCPNLESLTLCNQVYTIPTYQNRMFSGATKILNGTGSIYVASDMYSRWIAATGWSSFASIFVSIEQSEPVLSFSNGLVSGLTRYISGTFLSYLGITNSQVTDIYLDNIIDLNVQDTFLYYHNLNTVNLPLCETINHSVFKGCDSLSQVSLPKCKSLGDNVFYDCNSLSYLDLPVCSYIGRYAFYTYPAVSLTLVLRNSSVVGRGSITQLIDTTGIEKLSIFVPSSLVDEYKVNEGWSTYASRFFPIPE